MVAVKRRRVVQLLNAGNLEGYSFLETRGPVRKTGSGYVIVTRPSGGSSEKEGGFFGKTRGKIGNGTFGNGRKARCESRRAKIYADRRRPGGGPQHARRRRRRAGCRAGEAFDAGGLWPGRIP